MPKENFFSNISRSEELFRKILSYLPTSHVEAKFISHLCTSFNKLNADLEEYHQWVEQLNLDEMLEMQHSNIEKYEQTCSDILFMRNNGPVRRVNIDIYKIKEEIRAASYGLQSGDLTSHNIPTLAQNTLDVICKEYEKINNKADEFITALENSEKHLERYRGPN